MRSPYPLQWPEGKARAKYRRNGEFKVDQARALADLGDELRLMGAKDVTITSNPGNAAADAGIAVYFFWKDREYCIACDRFYAKKHNLRAIGLSIAAMRSMVRYGTDDLFGQAMEGFALDALPMSAARHKRPWFEVLGVFPQAPRAVVDAAYRALAKTAHPDGGGSDEAFKELSEAYDAAKEAVKA